MCPKMKTIEFNNFVTYFKFPLNKEYKLIIVFVIFIEYIIFKYLSC